MSGLVGATGLVWLLADAPDFVGTLLVIAIMLIGAIAQLVNKAREAQKQAGQRKAPGPPQGPEKRDPLADEIEEFLKRATQRRQAGGRKVVSPPAPIAGGSEATQPESTRRLVQAPDVERAPLESELIPLEGQPESVAAHVAEQLSAAKFAAASQELGKEVTDLDRGLQRHLHETFDQQVGRLSGMGGESATAQGAVDLGASSQAADAAARNFTGLAALLADPGSVRQAIVFSEIFNRPESRWV